LLVVEREHLIQAVAEARVDIEHLLVHLVAVLLLALL
jgi:hypothetical protein